MASHPRVGLGEGLIGIVVTGDICGISGEPTAVRALERVLVLKSGGKTGAVGADSRNNDGSALSTTDLCILDSV